MLCNPSVGKYLLMRLSNGHSMGSNYIHGSNLLAQFQITLPGTFGPLSFTRVEVLSQMASGLSLKSITFDFISQNQAESSRGDGLWSLWCFIIKADHQPTDQGELWEHPGQERAHAPDLERSVALSNF